MSKKNNLSRRKNQYGFDLRREKKEREKKVDRSSSSSKKKGSTGFQVGKKKVKTKMIAFNKAKAAQAMDLNK
ncbi:hypothetical protein MKX01_022527 [Papaver californicum]|nr:hypothetical protein MKX01_022527 [Papaver californicum]